jgi:hypothetical protein
MRSELFAYCASAKVYCQTIGGAKVVQVTMIVEEKEIEVTPGVFVQAMTFNGTNPGPMIWEKRFYSSIHKLMKILEFT